MKNILILGYGQIGQSIEKLYYNRTSDYSVYYIDLEIRSEDIPTEIDILHVCIPYNSKFLEIVKKHIEIYSPVLTIIHSTVMFLTTEMIYDMTGAQIVYSPIMGRHPNLTKSIQTFTKIVAGITDYSASLACKHFEDLGIKTTVYKKLAEAEVAKLCETTYYGLIITYMQNVHALCDEWNLDFSKVYTETNNIYNHGYKELGETQFIRPVLKFQGNGIGGHCVFENAKILKQSKMMIDIVTPILKLGQSK